MQSKSLLKNFLSYLRHPQYYTGAPKKSWKRKAFDLARLFALMYFISLFCGFLIYLVTESTGYNFDQNSVVDIVQNQPIIVAILLAVIIAPITEEFTFRLFLRFSYVKFAIASTFILITVIDLISAYILPDFLPEWFLSLRSVLGGFSYLAFLIIFALAIYFLAKRFINNDRAEKFYTKHFGKLFYTSILTFGLIHIGNYNELGSLILLAPILILPQINAGTFLGYIRMNYGFKFGILTHACYNLLTLLPVIILSFGSATLKDIVNGKTTDLSGIFNYAQSDLVLLGIVELGALCMFIVFLILNGQLLWEFFKARRVKLINN